MNQNRRTAFVLAAGLGTRLKELTKDNPKALVTINNKPLLKVILENLTSNGFNHIVVNIHHFGDKIIRFLEDNKFPGIDIEISDERDLLMDTGGAILKAMPLFLKSEAVLVHNVDVLTDVNLKEFYDNFINSKDAAWLLTQQRNSKRKLVFDKNDNFLGRFNTETNIFDGKGLMPKDCKTLSFSGIHLFKPQYFKDFELKPCYIFELYKAIAEKNYVRSQLIHPDYWFDLGTQEQLKNAESWLSSTR